MIKSELIQSLAKRHQHLSVLECERTIEVIFDEISAALTKGDRVELRNFGTFTVKKRRARKGRNPRTGENVTVPEKSKAFFKTGRALYIGLNGGKKEELSE